jgi:hypothetical protein
MASIKTIKAQVSEPRLMMPGRNVQPFPRQAFRPPLFPRAKNGLFLAGPVMPLRTMTGNLHPQHLRLIR